jgi:hypothetical protein
VEELRFATQIRDEVQERRLGAIVHAEERRFSAAFATKMIPGFRDRVRTQVNP